MDSSSGDHFLSDSYIGQDESDIGSLIMKKL